MGGGQGQGAIQVLHVKVDTMNSLEYCSQAHPPPRGGKQKVPVETMVAWPRQQGHVAAPPDVQSVHLTLQMPWRVEVPQIAMKGPYRKNSEIATIKMIKFTQKKAKFRDGVQVPMKVQKVPVVYR